MFKRDAGKRFGGFIGIWLNFLNGLIKFVFHLAKMNAFQELNLSTNQGCELDRILFEFEFNLF